MEEGRGPSFGLNLEMKEKHIVKKLRRHQNTRSFPCVHSGGALPPGEEVMRGVGKIMDSVGGSVVLLRTGDGKSLNNVRTHTVISMANGE